MEPAVPSPYFSIVLPPTIEPAHLETCVAGVCEVLDGSAPERYEIVIVDNDEKGLASIAEALTPIYRQLKVIRSSEPVVTTAWGMATGDVLGVLDGNLLQKPTSLSQLIASIEEGADLAVLGQYQSAKPDGDDTVGCLVIRRQCLKNLDESPEGCKILVDILGADIVRQIKKEFGERGVVANWNHFAEAVRRLLKQ